MVTVGSYWTLEYKHPSGRDETHVVKVYSISHPIVKSSGYFVANGDYIMTKQNLISDFGKRLRPSSVEEIELYKQFQLN